MSEAKPKASEEPKADQEPVPGGKPGRPDPNPKPEGVQSDVAPEPKQPEPGPETEGPASRTIWDCSRRGTERQRQAFLKELREFNDKALDWFSACDPDSLSPAAQSYLAGCKELKADF